MRAGSRVYKTGSGPGQDGYMTVEASFVIPWVVFIVVWIIYLGFFEYDRCVVFQDNYRLATQTASQICSTADQQNWLNGHIKTVFGKKYLGTRRVDTEGKVGSREIEVYSSITVAHPLSFHARMIPISNWKLTDRVSADNFSYTGRLRTFRTVGRILGGG